MMNLLQLEWKKMKEYRIFQVLTALYIIALPGLMLIPKTFDKLPEEFISQDAFYMFPDVWKYFAYAGNWLTFFFLGFLAVICVTSEFGNRTLRQNIITGMSRKKFFMGKLYFILAISLAATLYYVLNGLLFGYFHTETIYLSKVLQEADLIPRYFLMCMAYMSFGLFVGILIRRTGIALFLYLAYVMFLEPILRYAVHFKIIQNKSLHFYPMNAAEDLAPIYLPVNDMAESFAKSNDFSIFLTPMEAVITSCIYTSIFIFASYLLIKARDL